MTAITAALAAQPAPVANSDAETPIVTPWYEDKALYAKILLPVITIATAWLNSKLPIPLSPETMTTLVAGFCAATVTYIAGHKYKTMTLQKAQIAATAAVAAAQGADPAAGLAASPK
jgi:hypothetical protein